MIDSEINTFVKDLGRPHPSGGIVIERAAIVAQGKKSGVQYYFIEDETSDPVGNIPPSLDYLATLGLKP